MRRGGPVGVALLVIVALALSACSGGDSSNAASHDAASTSTTSAPSATATTAAAGAGQGTGGSTGSAHQGGGSASSTPHGSTTSAPAATTTTLHNTIHPLPGSPVAPAIDTNYTTATAEAPTTTDPYGRVEGECFGNPATVHVAVEWHTYDTDFVQLNRQGKYAAEGIDNDFSLECPDPNLFSQPEAELTVTAFGAGGEVSYTLYVAVDKHYH